MAGADDEKLLLLLDVMLCTNYDAGIDNTEALNDRPVTLG
jgi:hypothetical protein